MNWQNTYFTYNIGKNKYFKTDWFENGKNNENGQIGTVYR